MSSIKIAILIAFFILLFVFLLLVSKTAVNVVSKKKIAIAASGTSSHKKSRKIVIVCKKMFGRISARLLNFRFIDKGANNIVLLFTIKGLKVNESEVVSCLLCISFLAGIFGLVVAGSPVFALSVSLCVIVGALVFSGTRLTKATNEMREQVPDAIQCMANCSSSGFSLMQTFEQAEKECQGPLQKTFSLAHKRLKLGASVEEALAVFDMMKSVPELKFISVAFRVQHVSGGPISEVLDCARESVLSELELARTLRVQTAQAKMSASIVTCMPFVLLALFSFMSPGFLTLFFTSFIGIAIFCLAFIMQATGVLIVRKTLSRCEG